MALLQAPAVPQADSHGRQLGPVAASYRMTRGLDHLRLRRWAQLEDDDVLHHDDGDDDGEVGQLPHLGAVHSADRCASRTRAG
jgi:hypothetical protein